MNRLVAVVALLCLATVIHAEGQRRGRFHRGAAGGDPSGDDHEMPPPPDGEPPPHMHHRKGEDVQKAEPAQACPSMDMAFAQLVEVTRTLSHWYTQMRKCHSGKPERYTTDMPPDMPPMAPDMPPMAPDMPPMAPDMPPDMPERRKHHKRGGLN